MSRLKGKTAVVTGGSRGIGRGIVGAFIKEGARVLSCGRRDRPDDLPDTVMWEQVDVSNRADVERLAARARDAFGQTNILVNNAGIQAVKTILESSDADWETVMGTNARGVFLLCRAFIPDMSPGGSIINIGSISGLVADPKMALYNASKAFVHGLTRSIALDHGPAVRCNTIAPGWIDTGMAENAFSEAADPAAAREAAERRHSVKRLGQVADVAALAVWLASDEADFASGQCYVIDGGLTARSPLDG